MRSAVILCLVSVGLLGGCAEEPSAEIRVSAASSLTEVLDEVVVAFEASNPEYAVVLNLGSTAHLREQILGGAPVDVFASADAANMKTLVEEGKIIGDAVPFATNRMEIAVPAGNPGGVAGLADFARTDLLLGLCAAVVPCGDLALDIFLAANVVPAPHTEEPNVRALVTKVASGELDAGIVYITDVLGNGDIEGIAIPTALNATTAYLVGSVVGALEPVGADAFVAFLASDEARSIFSSHGYGSS
jgi:molybdate transport system substrate-binding protein